MYLLTFYFDTINENDCLQFGTDALIFYMN
jgi:hypothetical protein